MKRNTYARVQLSAADAAAIRVALRAIGGQAVANAEASSTEAEKDFHKGVAAWSLAEDERLGAAKGGQVNFSLEQLKRAIGSLETSRRGVMVAWVEARTGPDEGATRRLSAELDATDELLGRLNQPLLDDSTSDAEPDPERDDGAGSDGDPDADDEAGGSPEPGSHRRKP